jgi:hypothetical protein
MPPHRSKNIGNQRANTRHTTKPAICPVIKTPAPQILSPALNLSLLFLIRLGFEDPGPYPNCFQGKSETMNNYEAATQTIEALRQQSHEVDEVLATAVLTLAKSLDESPRADIAKELRAFYLLLQEQGAGNDNSTKDFLLSISTVRNTKDDQ